MRTLVPQFESFYESCCKYLQQNHTDKFYEGSVGIPKIYKEVRDSKGKFTTSKLNFVKSKKKNQKRVGRGCFVFNKLGTVAFDNSESRNFTFDGKNAFRHKRKANVRTSTRKQKFYKPPEISTDFYFDNEEVFKKFDEFDLPSHVIVDGCFETNRHTIQKQIDCRNFSGEHLPIVDDYFQMKTAIRDTIRKMKISNLGEVCEESLYDFDFNLDTKPGYRFENYFNCRSKRDCPDLAVELAKLRYRRIVSASREGRIINRKEIIPGIYTIGARNARKDDYEVGEEVTSRAVHMPEWHTELHSGLFSDLITNHIVESGVGPIYIGNSFIKFDRFEKQMKDNFCAVEGDWSKFDASLCNSLITMALCVLRLYFPAGLLYDNHFLAILDSLVIKDYHVVGGGVLRIFQGLPSGSKWTSLVGSVLNLIVLNYSFSSVKYYDRSFAIGGDDFVAFIKNGDYNMQIVEEEVHLKSLDVGMTLKFYKNKNYTGSNNIDDYPVFYKYTVFHGVPVVPIESILERCFSPWNRKYNNTKEVLKLLDDLLPSLGHPTTACFVYYNFYRYCYYRFNKKNIPLEEIINRHQVVFNKLMKYNFDPLLFKDFYSSNKRNTFVNSIKLTKYVKKVFCIM